VAATLPKWSVFPDFRGSGSVENRVPTPDSLLAFFPRLRYQAPMTNESIAKLARSLAETLPEGLRAARNDLEKNFRAVLRGGLGKLDLVTREEFEVQEAVLMRTREKLESLQARLEALESTAAAKKTVRTKAAKKKPRKKKVTKK